MKKTRKIGALLICFTMVISNTVSVLASENVETCNPSQIQEIITIEPVEGNVTVPEETEKLVISNPLLRDGYKPTTTWDISTEGQYNFEYSVYLNNTCYSGHNFTGVTSAVLFVNSESDTGVASNYTIKIYKNNFSIIPDTLIGSHVWSTDTDHTKQINISNMDKNAKYYFKIVPSNTYLSGWGYLK